MIILHEKPRENKRSFQNELTLNTIYTVSGLVKQKKVNEKCIGCESYNECHKTTKK